jgi:hypothetical protein
MWPFARRDPASLAMSVVMPSFEQSRFIRAAALSVLQQGVPGCVELIVVDGGSTDETLAHLVDLSAAYPGRIRWFSAPDNGPAQAVNRAVELSRGAVIGWLNSDDLYLPGAMERALQHFAARPDDVMVYGEGEHVDEAGAPLGRYPSLPPGTPLSAFADGCFICQPTAFFRRDVFLAIGGLDESLRAAFDFDLWVRFFQRHAGRIGWIPAIQAQSRLHAGGITLSQRERVALEGLTVVGRHLRSPPAHWLLTHFSELAAQHPFQGEVRDLREKIEAVIEKAKTLVAPAALSHWYEHLAQDRSVQLSTPWLQVDMQPDGWAGTSIDVRLRQPTPPVSAIALACRNAAPGVGLLRLTIWAPGMSGRELFVEGVGPFQIALDVEDLRPDARVVFRITSEDYFVPAYETGSDDFRRLAFLIDDVTCVVAKDSVSR